MPPNPRRIAPRICSDLIFDRHTAIIIDVEATRAIRQAEVGAARTMIERTEERLGLCPERLAADSAYGSAEMLGWLVNKHAIEPHIPVFDSSSIYLEWLVRGLLQHNLPGTDILPVVGLDLTAFERSHSRAVRNRSLICVAGSAPGTNDLAFLGRFRHAVIVPHS